MIRFYRALLRLYPTSFRLEYQAELCAVFAEQVRGEAGALGALRSAVRAVADVVPNALAAHWDVLRQDVRYAGRVLIRTPTFAITAVVVAALGVGANTAAFSLADFVLLRPLPFPSPDRLVKIWQRSPGGGRNQLSPGNYRDYKAMTRSVDAMEAYTGRAANLVGAGEPRRLELVAATPEFLQLMGVPALAGRVFQPGDSTSEQVVVISHALWQTQFGGDPGILDAVVRLDGQPFRVIGVMPAEFRFPSRTVEAWTPLFFHEDDYADRTDTYLDVVARLKPGASLEQARGDFADIAVRLERAFPKENRELGALVLGLRDELSARARLLVIALCGAALCILLLACANLASLFLARSLGRARELAVRSALGAGRERLVRQLVTESLAIAVVGGVVGVAVAMAGLPLLARLVPESLPTAAQPSVNLRVLLFAAVLVGLTGLGFGVGPAIAAGRSPLLDGLRQGARAGGGRTRRLRAGLVIVEVAASVVLLVSSGLLLRAVLRIQAIDPGFQSEGVVAFRTTLPTAKYALTLRRNQFYGRVLDDVRALPGVRSAAYVTGLPMGMRGGIWPVAMPGAEEVVATPANSASLRFVTPQFFATLGIPVREGRDVSATDTRASPLVAVVSQSFARRHWPNEPAAGKRFTIALSERTVVGVVGDVRVRGLEQTSEPQVYLPATQQADSSLINYPPKDLVVRSAGAAGTLAPAIRRIVAAVDPEQPVSDVRTLTEIVDDETASRMTQLRLLGVMSAIALLIAGIGIHGLLTFTVTQRTQEIGIRRALGEQSSSVLGRVFREGLVLALVGIGIGVWLAYLAAQAMRALLADVGPGDPATMLLAASLCLVTALIGSLRPALWASRVDPLTALRQD